MAFNLLKPAWEEARSQIVHVGVQYLGPWVLAAMVLLSGAFGEWPVFLWITAGVITFAAASFGIFYFIRLMQQLTVEGKIKIVSFSLAKRYDDVGDEKRVVAVSYAVTFINDAEFPIEWEIVPQQVSLGASINPNPRRDISSGLAQGKTGMGFKEAEIPIADTMHGKLVEGKMEV
jgi:hypothetical protein